MGSLLVENNGDKELLKILFLVH